MATQGESFFDAELRRNAAQVRAPAAVLPLAVVSPPFPLLWLACLLACLLLLVACCLRAWVRACVPGRPKKGACVPDQAIPRFNHHHLDQKKPPKKRDAPYEIAQDLRFTNHPRHELKVSLRPPGLDKAGSVQPCSNTLSPISPRVLRTQTMTSYLGHSHGSFQKLLHMRYFLPERYVAPPWFALSTLFAIDSNAVTPKMSRLLQATRESPRDSRAGNSHLTTSRL